MVGWKHWSLLFFTRQSCSPEDSSVGTALKHRGVYIAILSVLALELMIVTFPTTAGCCVLRKQKGKAEEWRVSWNSLHYLSIARISVRFEEQSYAFCDSVLGLWWDLPEVKVLWQPRRACAVCSEEDMVLSPKSGKLWGQNLNAKHWALLSAALSFPLQCWNSPRFFTEPTSCHCWLWHMAVTCACHSAGTSDVPGAAEQTSGTVPSESYSSLSTHAVSSCGNWVMWWLLETLWSVLQLHRNCLRVLTSVHLFV